MSSREQLKRLLEKHIQSEISAEEVIQLAEDAFRRAAAPRPSRAVLGAKAERLGKAAREIAKALGSVGDLHFFLREVVLAAAKAKAKGSDKERDIERKSIRREFDKKTKPVFSNLETLQEAFRTIAEACDALTDPNCARPVFSREGKPVDEGKKQLGFELAALWHWATGKSPAASGSASFDRPGTPFGCFVALCAQTSKKRTFWKMALPLSCGESARITAIPSFTPA